MSLDTVDLIFEIETYFHITIPDTDAEQVRTVGDLAGVVSRKLAYGGTAAESRTFYIVFSTVRRELQAVLRLAKRPNADELLGEYLAAADEALDQPFLNYLAAQTGWLVPRLRAIRPVESSWKFRILGRKPARWPDWTQNTLADLAGWIMSHNYRSFFPEENFANRFVGNAYDISRAVTGIVAEKSGVEVWEIQLQDSITDDLGMD
jgi:acyl carrier protein